MVTLFRGKKFLTLQYKWGWFPEEPKFIPEWELPAVLEATAEYKDPPTHMAIGGNFDELVPL